MTEGFSGMIFSINQEYMQVFDWKKNKMIAVPYQDGFELGECIEKEENGGYEYQIHSHDTDIERDVRGDEVFVKTVAMCPHIHRLNRDRRRKYKNAIWSPYFHLLNDPNKIFKNSVEPNDLVEVTIKYAPMDGKYFEVVEVHELPDEQKFIDLTPSAQIPPWIMETTVEVINDISYPAENDTIVQHEKTINNSKLFVGIAIFTDRNLQFADNKDGSTQLCTYVFNSEIGIIRRPQDDPQNDIVQVGKWYIYKANDTRKGRNKNSKKTAIQTTTCGVVKPYCFPPLSTQFVDGTLHIETSFLFKPDIFETSENRTIPSWEIRKKGLSKFSHFFDPHLGRVEIYPKQSEIIVREVETFWKRSTIENVEKEPIIVVVDASPFPLKNVRVYPREGFFFVIRTVRIILLCGGELIYES